MKNIRVFLSENFQLLEVKLSIYLNRRVFVKDEEYFQSMHCLSLIQQDVYTSTGSYMDLTKYSKAK